MGIHLVAGANTSTSLSAALLQRPSVFDSFVRGCSALDEVLVGGGCKTPPTMGLYRRIQKEI